MGKTWRAAALSLLLIYSSWFFPVQKNFGQAQARQAESIKLPVLQAVNQLGGDARAIAIAGSAAYVGRGARLLRYDLSAPETPVLTWQSEILAGVVWDVMIAGDNVLTAVRTGSNNGGALVIYDCSDPENIVEAGKYRVADGAYAVWSAEDGSQQVYLAAKYVYILDLSDPTRPKLNGKIETPDYADEIVVRGELAYALAGTSLYIYNVSNPLAPNLVGAYQAGTGAYTHRVALVGDYAYVAAGAAGLKVVNVANPAAPQEVGEYNSPGEAYDILIDGQTAFVADWTKGLVTLDISAPGDPVYMGSADTPGTAEALAKIGNYVYLADGGGELRVIEVSNPSAPNPVGWQQSVGATRGLGVAGNRLFAADHGGWLHILEVNQAGETTSVGDYEGIPYSTNTILIANGIAYLAGEYEGLALLEVSDPQNIVEIEQSVISGSVLDLALNGNYLFIASGDDGLQIVDASDPYNLQARGALNLNDWTRCVAAAGNILFLGAGSNIKVIDASNPDAPQEIASIPVSYAADVAVSGEVLIVADRYSGTKIYSVSNPGAPSYLGSLPGGDSYAVSANNLVLYVADRAYGVRAYDISDSTAPRQSGAYAQPYDIFTLTAGSEYSFASDFDAGLLLLERTDISAQSVYLPQVTR